jgi:2-C-methyl-D-erythritol 4-phosphate cytidylyltransferase
VGVIIVAAGRGQRMGEERPKQLLDLGGRSLLRRSVEAFDGHPDIVEIVVVLPAELVDEGLALVGATQRLCRITAGGERRQDSVRAGLSQLSQPVSVILIHDAARPFADTALIDRVIAGAREPAPCRRCRRATPSRVPAGQSIVAETIPRQDIYWRRRHRDFAGMSSSPPCNLPRRKPSSPTKPCSPNVRGYSVRVSPATSAT